MNAKIVFLAGCTLLAQACSKNDRLIKPGAEGKGNSIARPLNGMAGTIPTVMPTGSGIRIAWDFSTLKRLAPNADYARMIQLNDQSLLAIYQGGSSIYCTKSTDLGNTWSAPITIAAPTSNIAMCTPDVVQLNDHSILACYNPRKLNDAVAGNYGIRTKKSYDGGLTWTDERLLYQAGTTFDNGCWEPSAVQLPNGEIQLFFSNEGIYTTTNEQNISLLRSADNGLTWTTNPEITSFRPTRRDGMPSPVVMQNGTDIVYSIEDNLINFKPYTIRSTIANNWATTVGANSPDRIYALKDTIPDVYAGAPYLRQLKTGETILSYQGTEARINNINNAQMEVVIGDNNAKNFTRKSVPFAIIPSKSGLWNSVAVVGDNTVIGLTSTSNYSGGNTEVWMIKGHVIPDLAAAKIRLSTYLNLNATALSNIKLPVFIGHVSATQLSAGIAYDDNYLYFYDRVKDAHVSSGTGPIDNGDGVNIFIDAKNHSYTLPDTGVFKIFISATGGVLLREGSSGNWVDRTNTSIIKTTKLIPGGYIQGIGVPWNLLNGKPATGAHMGYNFSLVENTGGAAPAYIETIMDNTEYPIHGLRLCFNNKQICFDTKLLVVR